MAMGAGELQALVQRTVEGLGYELVDCERAAGGLLRVTLDVPAVPPGVTLEDCERVSRQLTHLFAVEDIDYTRLEVGSPGLDRPLKTVRDFARFTGEQARVELHAPLDGRKRFTGYVLAPEGERLRLELTPEAAAAAPGQAKKAGGKAAAKRAVPAAPGKVIEFVLADIEKARLVPRVSFGSGSK
jgi:ribosome maturation factor RimP